MFWLCFQILEMRHDSEHSALITRGNVGGAVSIHFWALPSLELFSRMHCPEDITDFARLVCTGTKYTTVLLYTCIVTKPIVHT